MKIGLLVSFAMVAALALTAYAETTTVVVPFIQIPPAAQRTIIDNVGAGSMISKVEKKTENGQVVYVATVVTPGGRKDVIAVGADGRRLGTAGQVSGPDNPKSERARTRPARQPLSETA